jgi:cysteine desulfurase / selenocysteine lyase
MPTKTPIAEPGLAIVGLAYPPGLPDEAELNRLANAIFSSLPGRDQESVDQPVPDQQGSVPAARDASDVGTLTPVPLSLGGFGASPTGIKPEAVPLASVTMTEYGGGSAMPGSGVPPAGLSGIAPAQSFAAPSAAGTGFGLSPGAVAVPPVPTLLSPAGLGDVLYIIAEAQGRPSQDSPTVTEKDWLAVHPQTLSGLEDIVRLLDKGEPTQTASLPDRRESEWESAPHLADSGYPAFDVQAVRRDFPILQEKIHGRPLIWFDNGATTQKPQAVIDRLAYFYSHENSNVHRGAHTLAARATDAYENARKTVGRFLGASSPDEIVFLRGTTEAINLVAQAWGRQNVGEGDEIVISHLEHHANIVPWQQLISEKGAKLRVIPVDDSGQILLNEYERLLSDKTKIVAITHVSNALGTVVPIKAVIDRAHTAGAKVLIDGAQSVAHSRVNVQSLDADFFVFSGHKIFGPTGIGALYGKRDILNAMPPWQGGGIMITDVTFERTTYQAAPGRFEAGTGNLADAAGLATALEYVEHVGLEAIARHEHDLLVHATEGLKTVPGLKLIGTAAEKAAVLSFLLDGFTPEEVGAALDEYGIAVRAGHHCAQPIVRRFGVEGTVRASLALYNTHDEVDCFVSALRQIAASRGRGLRA